jgi:hypothetical protein
VIDFKCDHCGRRIMAPTACANHCGKCPNCQRSVRIPASPNERPDSSTPRANQAYDVATIRLPGSPPWDGMIVNESNPGVTVMVIEFQPNGCGQRHRARGQLGGKISTCKKCGQAIRAPKAGTNSWCPRTSAEVPSMSDESRSPSPARAIIPPPQRAALPGSSMGLILLAAVRRWAGIARSDSTAARSHASPPSAQTSRDQDNKYHLFSCDDPSGTVRESDDAQNQRVQFLDNRTNMRLRITMAQGRKMTETGGAEKRENVSHDLLPKDRGTSLDASILDRRARRRKRCFCASCTARAMVSLMSMSNPTYLSMSASQ